MVNMAYTIDKKKLHQYRLELLDMETLRMKKWKIKSDASNQPEYKKLRDKMDESAQEYRLKMSSLVSLYLQNHGYYKIKFDEKQMQVLKRVVGKIRALVIDEANKVAEKHNIALSDYDDTKWRWCDWYLTVVEEGKMTDELIKAECRKYKAGQ